MYIHKIAASCATLIAFAILPNQAHANDVRLGFMLQDIKLPGIGGVQGKEKSEAVSLDIVFDSPAWMPLGLRPYVGGTLNLSDKTNYGGAGLLIQPKLTENIYSEFGLGLVLHDGTLEIPLPGTGKTAEDALALDRRHASEIEFGTSLLFRIEFAMGYRFNDDWAVEAVLEHISHGKILSSGPNEGLDAGGLRIARRF